MRPATSLQTKTKSDETTPSGCRASLVLLRAQALPALAIPGRPPRSCSAGLAAVAVSGCCVLFPSRYFAGAVVAGGRLSSSVPSASPVVAAVRVAVARSQRLAALVPQGGSRLAQLFPLEKGHHRRQDRLLTTLLQMQQMANSIDQDAFHIPRPLLQPGEVVLWHHRTQLGFAA